MNAKVQLRGFDKDGNVKVFETNYGNTKSYDLDKLCDMIVDSFFQIPYRKNNVIKEYQVTVEFYIMKDEEEICLYTILPFMVECQTNDVIRIHFFNNQMFRGNITNKVIDTIDRNFLQMIVKTEIEKINITNF